jgi:hypothetical protein
MPFTRPQGGCEYDIRVAHRQNISSAAHALLYSKPANLEETDIHYAVIAASRKTGLFPSWLPWKDVWRWSDFGRHVSTAEPEIRMNSAKAALHLGMLH